MTLSSLDQRAIQERRIARKRLATIQWKLRNPLKPNPKLPVSYEGQGTRPLQPILCRDWK